MSVHRSQVEPLHIVECDWRVDQEAEQARADKIPERNGYEEIDRPFVSADPGTVSGTLRQADVLPCLETDQY